MKYDFTRNDFDIPIWLVFGKYEFVFGFTDRYKLDFCLLFS
jgi:hypothetical protein